MNQRLERASDRRLFFILIGSFVMVLVVLATQIVPSVIPNAGLFQLGVGRRESADIVVADSALVGDRMGLERSLKDAWRRQLAVESYQNPSYDLGNDGLERELKDAWRAAQDTRLSAVSITSQDLSGLDRDLKEAWRETGTQ